MDPKAGNQLFGIAAEAFMASSALDAGPDTRAGYLSCYRGNIKERLACPHALARIRHAG